MCQRTKQRIITGEIRERGTIRNISKIVQIAAAAEFSDRQMADCVSSGNDSLVIEK